MLKMKTLTVNGQTYAVEDADSATLLRAEISNDGKTCSHTAGEIYSHIQSGGVAAALCLGEYLPLESVSAQEAVFGNTLVVSGVATTAQFLVDSQGNVTARSASGGGASVNEVIQALGKTEIPSITATDAEVKRVLITQVGGEGIHVEHAGQNVLYFQETADSNDVILRGIAPGETDTDAVSKAQLDTALGDIEAALDNIIAIQNTLIGGDEA